MGGGPPGDLYVVIGVQEHPFFRRDGNDLVFEMPVSYPTLALGGEITVPTLDGTDKLKIPEWNGGRIDVPVAQQGCQTYQDAGAATSMSTCRLMSRKN